MKNFKIILEYDGTNYNGWQRQDGDKKISTVQGVVEGVLKKVFCKKVSVTGSGRTDSGVHAVGQCASFKVNTKIPISKIFRAVNTYLPEDIVVKEIKKVHLSFNARFGAKRKWYRYVIVNKKFRAAIDRNYAVHYPYKLDVNLMKKAAKIIKGRHDFSAIVLRHEGNNIRKIFDIKIFRNKDYVYFDITGNGFLYKMARRIAGVLIDVGRSKIDIEDVKKLISGNKLGSEIQTAPAKGLVLMKVYY